MIQLIYSWFLLYTDGEWALLFCFKLIWYLLQASGSLYGALLGSLVAFIVADILGNVTILAIILRFIFFFPVKILSYKIGCEGRKRELMVAASLYLAGALITALAIDLPVVVIGRFVYGMGIGLVCLSII